MLLLHQAGSVKIGEVVRYTVTYTPSADRILPSPEFLFLRIRNTSAIALRAAFVHGPYTLSVAAYPSHFNPNQKFENPRRYGVPEFEPMLKAGAVWNCHLVVPDNIRQTAGEGMSDSGRHSHFADGPNNGGESASWIIEIASQVIFSTSAAVHYEILLARDEKSLNLGSVVPVIGGQAQVPQPGRVSDFQQSIGSKKHHPAQLKGVYSKAIRLKVEDTATLWNTPQLPGWEYGAGEGVKHDGADAPVEPVVPIANPQEKRPPKRQKKVHLVLLTHGLHSNLGGDMLFLKESIDTGVRQAKVDAKVRKARERATRAEAESGADATGREGHSAEEDGSDDDVEEEEVVVRGFSGNATKTEKGIKYLGKRLARYVLSMTYPDQPCQPTAATSSESSTLSFRSSSHKQDELNKKTAKHGATTPRTIPPAPPPEPQRLYKFTKISFIAHSLGGLVQMYAIAYIQKHSPQFFDLIEPINFITLASPFLGLNHENPLYVKFALDFGLVGRTGQDLGLTWRAPTIARSGWGAIVGNLGENAHRRVYGEPQPESKPLLRILPTGPAHKALQKFRNRTVYSNVVNDGIVPLRTSCLLFLDWQGLGRVEKARREGGLVEAVVGFGWAELTGANVTSPRLAPWSPIEIKVEDDESTTSAADTAAKSIRTGSADEHEVPQPPTNATLEDDAQSLRSAGSPPDLHHLQFSSNTNNSNPFTGFFNFFRSNDPPKAPPPPSQKQTRIYQRSQTLKMDSASGSNSAASSNSKVTTGQELTDDLEGMSAPPRTTFFESAGDLLNPKLPSVEYLIDPSKRPRTIFHDRIYHPSDIPPPPLKKRPSSTFRRRSYTRTPSFATPSPRSAMATAVNGSDPVPIPAPFASLGTPQPPHLQEDPSASSGEYADTVHTNSEQDPLDMVDSSQMKVEEKIARAYHRDLSWRKVLVKLEPDAHNNLIVRRMFANAFGWPVVNHLVEAHFSDSAAARTRDDEEPNTERAKNPAEPPDESGVETTKTTHQRSPSGNDSTQELKDPKTPSTSERQHVDAAESSEALDFVSDLPPSSSSPSAARKSTSSSSASPPPQDQHDALGVSFFPSTDAVAAAAAAAMPTRPRFDRIDSVTWSERDWADSGDESDDSTSVNNSSSSRRRAKAKGAATERQRSASPLSFGNWAEKIVGKVATQRPRSARSSGPGGADAEAPSDGSGANNSSPAANKPQGTPD
ncbi:putative serine esterase-domain-containing protein [Lasiosphaeria ovina]|uniref:Serine esterase-domain-containing protein n=1 Tax=Lasiosphaeria ovina TaxID=92902 RepID=A0AAE0NED8_9PEZI|nr:putative serine esterase-domain-containing protein [Lasiosphaeria ovina]